jgi:MoxR-like ATPase
MLKVLVGYPSSTEEFVIVERMTGALQDVQPVFDTEELMALQRQADSVYVDPALMEYSVKLVTATRQPEVFGLDDLKRYILFGASPRASINMVIAGRALAFVRGRDYALPQDIRDVVLDVTRHRLVLSYEALSDNVESDDILGRLMEAVPMPEVPLREYAGARPVR